MAGKISDRPFEHYYKEHEQYIRRVCHSAHAGNVYLDIDDTFQELCIVALKLYERYGNRPEGDFIKLMKVGFCNRLATIAYKKCRQNEIESRAGHGGDKVDHFVAIGTPAPRYIGNIYEHVPNVRKLLKGTKYVTEETRRKISEYLADVASAQA